MGREQTPQEHKRQMVEMIMNGSTIEEASQKYGYGLTTVKSKWRTWAKELGYTPAPARQRAKDVPDDIRREIADQMARGEAASHLVRKYGVSEAIIYSKWREWAEESGIPAPPKRQVKARPDKDTGKKTKETAQERAKRRAVRLKDQGISTKEVAEKTGFPAGEIDLYWRQWARELRIEIIQPIRKAPPPQNGPVERYFMDERGRQVRR